MTAWQQRVVSEKKENDLRAGRLEAFLLGKESRGLCPHEHGDLHAQLRTMRTLSAILGRRIDRFKPSSVPPPV